MNLSVRRDARIARGDEVARYSTHIVAALAITILSMQAACARHSTVVTLSGPDVQVPAGLDSAQTQAWIARQRANCRGLLVTLVDVRVFAVQCVADSSLTSHR
jgi:hypothetical protein